MASHLGPLDLVVLFAYLATVLIVGLSLRGKTKDLESYLLGDRNLPWWAILGSIVATETSTATVLSVPGEAYGPTGMKFLQLAIGYMVGRTIIVHTLLPLYFQGKLFTAYQVLDRRFGAATKRSASMLFLVTRNLGDGLRLYLAAIVLQQLAGMPFVWSVIVMGAVTILYTYFGGMRSVVWNDCIQFVVYMVGGIASVFVIAAAIPGGWQELVDFAAAHDKFQMFDFRLTLAQPYTFWAGLFGGATLTIGTHGTDQMMVQRYLSARSQADAGRAILASGVVVFLQFALFLFIGIQLASYYSHRPEVTFEKPDQVFAHFIVHVFPANTGLIGLMLAAILAAAMSTLSSSLNSSASAVVNDFIVSKQQAPKSPEQLFGLTRNLTILFGIVQIGIGIWANYLDNTVVTNALTIAGFSAGVLLGVFALGVLTRRAGQVSAIGGAAAGLVVLLALRFGNQLLHQANAPQVIPTIAWPWFALIGAVVTFLVGAMVAALFPQRGATE